MADIIATPCGKTYMVVGASAAGDQYIRGHYVAKKTKSGRERALLGPRLFEQLKREAAFFNLKVETRE